MQIYYIIFILLKELYFKYSYKKKNKKRNKQLICYYKLSNLFLLKIIKQFTYYYIMMIFDH